MHKHESGGHASALHIENVLDAARRALTHDSSSSAAAPILTAPAVLSLVGRYDDLRKGEAPLCSSSSRLLFTAGETIARGSREKM